MTSISYRMALCLALFASTACVDSPETDEAGLGHTGASLLDGTPDAIGVLQMLNDPKVTFEALDIDARLDRRAAQNLIEHRYGPDGTGGTADDDPFDNVAEVDAVPYVGPAALDRLVEYARAQGYVPQGGDLLGVFDGTAFTTAEAAAALDLVNTASETELDDAVGLDRRAAQSIIGARPIESLDHLAGLYYVGASALLKIRNYAGSAAPDQAGLAEGEACGHSDECGDALLCAGIPRDGSGTLGRCVDPTPLAGQGDSCDRWSPCRDEQLCAGTTLWGEGTCVAPWMAGRFINDGWYRIVDSEVAWDCGDSCPSVSSSIVVNGLASVPVDITVTVQIDHSSGRDLRVTLTDPNGDTAVLWENSGEVGRGVARSFVLNGISRDDQVNGRWTLTVADTEHGGGGWLKGWDLFIVSRWD